MGQLLPLAGHGDYYLWKYVPSLAGSIVFLLLFVAITAAHGYRMFTNRLWFCIPFFIGGIFQIIGYAGRAAANNATDKLGPYVIQSIFLLVSPALFAASIYMVLGRVILATRGESLAVVKPRWLTNIFVAGDVVGFLVQASGAGIMSSGGANSMTLGSNIIVAGLCIQIVMFGLFAVTAVVFHVRLAGALRDGRRDPESVRDVPWQGMLNMLYAVSALIMVRSIFRVVEYVMGNDGYPLEHEWTLFVFDSVLMFLTMLFFFVWYPTVLKPALERLKAAPSVEDGLEMTSDSTREGKHGGTASVQ